MVLVYNDTKYILIINRPVYIITGIELIILSFTNCSVLGGMKYFVVLLALFATTFAQQKGTCKAKILDNYVMSMSIYGSLFGDGLNEYYSFIGQNTLAELYLIDNKPGSIIYRNTSLSVINGMTGEFVLDGWLYSLYQNNTEYRIAFVNGEMSNCSLLPSGPVIRTSEVVSSLFTISPTQMLKRDPTILCQGAIVERFPVVFLNVLWSGGNDMDVIKSVAALSSEASINGEITEYHKLTLADKQYFSNPCRGPGVINNGRPYDQLIDRIYSALRHF